MNIVEGLAGGGFAIITKTHHAMVDGISAVDIAQVILDPHLAAARDTPPAGVDAARGNRAPSISCSTRCVIWSQPPRRGRRHRPDGRQRRTGDHGQTGRYRRRAGVAAARVAARPAPSSPLNVSIGAQRRFAVARTSLA